MILIWIPVVCFSFRQCLSMQAVWSNYLVHRYLFLHPVNFYSLCFQRYYRPELQIWFSWSDHYENSKNLFQRKICSKEFVQFVSAVFAVIFIWVRTTRCFTKWRELYKCSGGYAQAGNVLTLSKCNQWKLDQYLS